MRNTLDLSKLESFELEQAIHLIRLYKEKKYPEVFNNDGVRIERNSLGFIYLINSSNTILIDDGCGELVILYSTCHSAIEGTITELCESFLENIDKWHKEDIESLVSFLEESEQYIDESLLSETKQLLIKLNFLDPR